MWAVEDVDSFISEGVGAKTYLSRAVLAKKTIVTIPPPVVKKRSRHLDK